MIQYDYIYFLLPDQGRPQRHKPTDVAYAAGLFDGEGTVHVDKKLSVSISVSGNHMRMHEWLKENFGGSITSGGQTHAAGDIMSDGRVVQTDSVQEWKWRLHGQMALDFMELIYPYLIEKKSQVELVTVRRYLWPAKPSRLSEATRIIRTYVREELKRIRQTNGDVSAR